MFKSNSKSPFSLEILITLFLQLDSGVGYYKRKEVYTFDLTNINLLNVPISLKRPDIFGRKLMNEFMKNQFMSCQIG